MSCSWIFTFTYLSTVRRCSLFAFLLSSLNHRQEPQVIGMKKKTQELATEDDLLLDLTFHSVPASLLSEFTEKIVKPYFNGNLNAAIQDLIQKALTEQEFVLSHITHVRNSLEA